jgi:hypothetical protein
MFNKTPKCVKEITGEAPTQSEVDDSTQSYYAELIGNAIFCNAEGCTFGIEINKTPGLNRNCSGVCAREEPQVVKFKEKAVEVYRKKADNALNKIARIGLNT